MNEQTKKILIIEDDETISSMYQTSLANDGYEVVVAANGEDGLKVVQTQKPDIVLCDVMMPKMDGFAVLKELKVAEDTKHIPVIMLTNLGQDEDKAKGEQFGAADYLVKANLTPMQVSKKVAEHLQTNLTKK